MKMCLIALLFAVTAIVSGVERLTPEETQAHILAPRSGFTPAHLDWGKNIPDAEKLKVLFIVPQMTYRNVQDLQDRQKMDVVYCGTRSEKKFERIPDMIRKLSAKYDVIVLGNVEFMSLPNEAQFRILTAVEAGTGLVIVGERNPISYRKVLQNPVDKLNFPKRFDVTTRSNKRPVDFIKAWTLGKGRIVTVRYPVARGWEYYFGESLLPEMTPDHQYEARQENACALLLRTLRYAADGKDDVWSVAQAGKSLEFKNLPGKTVTLRFRDTENNVLLTKQLKSGIRKFALPVFPAGKLYCDMLLRDGSALKGFGAFSFYSSGRHGKMSVKLAEEILAPGQPVKGHLRWLRPLEQDCRLRVTMIGTPEYMVWEKREFQVAKGVRNFDFEIRNYSLPTIAGFLRCELITPDGTVIDKAEAEMFLKKKDLPSYFQYGWGGANTLNMARQMNHLAGWQGALLHPTEVPHNNLAYFNQSLVSYVIRIIYARGPKGEVNPGWPFLRGDLVKQMKALKSDMSFYRPEVQKLWRAAIEHRTGVVPKVFTSVYSLGDENGFNYEAGFGASDLPAFRKFIAKKYGTIAKYNKEHKTSYKSFAEVPHLTLKDAKAAGNYPAWFDHREYMERMYADSHNFARKVIREKNPDAIVGSEGSEPGNLELSIEEMDFWGPYNNVMFSEALRSFAPQKLRSLWWGSGYGASEPFPKHAKYMVLGTANSSAYYITLSPGTLTAFGGDCLPAAALQKHLPLLNRFRFGLGDLFNKMPMAKPEILLYWSHASQAASILDERLTNPQDGYGTVIPFCYRHALPFEFVSERTIDRLKMPSVKVLFLCGGTALSQKEVDAIRAFVQNGGTVITDRNAGVFNEYLRELPSVRFGKMFDATPFARIKQPKIMDDLRVKSSKGNVLESSKALVTPGSKYWVERKFGKGATVTANFNFAVVDASSKGAKSFDRFLQNELKSYGVRFPARLIGCMKAPVIRVREAADHKLIALSVDQTDADRKLKLILPEKAYIYDVFTGKMVYGKEFSWQDASVSERVFGVFASKQNAPAMKVDASVTRGQSLTIDLNGNSSSRVIGLLFTGPDGKKMYVRNISAVLADGKKIQFRTAFNDKPGKYKVRALDHSTGLFTDGTFIVK